MLLGVPKEIKDNEYRVGMVPSTVRELTETGHNVIVETGAGTEAGLPDGAYQAAGAEVVSGVNAVYSRAELIVKVKEPLAAERKKLQRGQVLFGLSASRTRPRTDRGPDGSGRHRNRLRNGDVATGHLAALDANVGSRRANGTPCGRATA